MANLKSYEKYKERTPEETIFEIQRILHGLGIFPVLRWIDQPLRGARANHLTLYPSSLGVNGKGTDELYASASAHAELMERLQNGAMMPYAKPDSFYDEIGFREFPDERIVPVDEILENPDPFTETVLSALGFTDYFTKHRFLDITTDLSGKTLTIPFADLTRHEICWVPRGPLFTFNTSNGMAAGNTMEEAMVQAFSEIFERYVNREILSGRAIPPTIPRQELEKYAFYQLIEQIEATGRYEVTLYDCSLGKGFPVAGCCIADLVDGTFGVKLGAHPSLAVSVERTLTEAFQGRNIEAFTHINMIGSLRQSTYYHNFPNVGKTGSGFYPYALFADEPGWAWQPWTRWEGLGNLGFLREMLKIAENEGWHVLARDSSFLGFPACQIVIPGVSNLHPFTPLKYRSVVSGQMLLNSWNRFPDLSEDEETRLLRLIQFKENAILENQIGSMSNKPLSSRFSMNKIAAYLALKHERFDMAAHYFKLMETSGEFPDDIAYLHAMAMYATARAKGQDGAQALAVVQKLSRKDVARRVCEDTEDLAHIMQRKFPRLSCFDCAHCDLAGVDCELPAVMDIMSKVYKAFDVNNVSQERLLRFSEGLWAFA